MGDATKDTFTLGEMRDARNKSARGEPLTDKEKDLADARRKAEGWGATPIYILDGQTPTARTPRISSDER